MHKPLTPPGISAVWTAPKKPPPYQALRAGGRHYFGFEITPDFEKATQAFLAGDGEAALRYYKRAEEDPHSGAAGAWRSAYEYVITLIQIGRPDLAGAERMELLDYIWRLEALHGEAFGRLGQMEQAESSLRRAQTVVDGISETMTTDEARIRFGSGKEKVTRHLVEIDVGKKDFDSLFQDMERGRTRAFVSMLAQRNISQTGEEPLVERIRLLDREILKERQRKNAFASRGKSREQFESNLLNQRAELITRLRGRAPDLADALAVSTIDLPSAQRRLKAGEVLAYALPPDDEKPYSLLLITREKAALKTLSIIPRDLRNKLLAFHRIRKEHPGRAIKITPAKPGESPGKNAETLALEELRRDLALADYGAFVLGGSFGN
ncbi:MAG: hypothetical protein QG555_1514 [Thermodesulfobacteriota bacterium]|nr:hypothetical protein [Thermodesulfobacteriota bacterium]